MMIDNCQVWDVERGCILRATSSLRYANDVVIHWSKRQTCVGYVYKNYESLLFLRNVIMLNRRKYSLSALVLRDSRFVDLV